MFPSASRHLVARVARRSAVVGQPARCLSGLTKTPEDAAKEKKERNQSPAGKPTIFDLKIETPIHKSNVWNISYNTENAGKSLSGDGQIMKTWRQSRYPPRRVQSSQSGRPVGLPNPTKPFSSMAAQNRPLAQTEHLFGHELQAYEIEEMPDLEVLRRIRVEPEEAPAPTEPKDEQTVKEDAEPAKPATTGSGTHSLPKFEDLPNDIYFRILAKSRPRVGIESGIKRIDNRHEKPRERLPDDSGDFHPSVYYAGW